MASDNLILRAGIYHVRLVIPKDVRHILNRTEFTESLRTGSKAEAQMKKFAYLKQWKQLVSDARKLVAGPPPADLPERAYDLSTLIEARQQSGLMNIVLNRQTAELDLSFSRERFESLAHEALHHIENAQRKYHPEFDPRKEKPFIDAQSFTEKWCELGEELTLEQKVERFNDFIRLNKSLHQYLLTVGQAINIESINESKAILENPKTYKSKSPFTKQRLENFSKYQRETKGIIEKTIDMQVSRIEKIKDWLEENDQELSHESVGQYLDSQNKIGNKTKKQYLFSGHSFWKWAIKYDSGIKGLFGNLKAPFQDHEFESVKSKGALRTDKRKAFTIEQLEKVYSEACTKKNSVIPELIKVAAYTGLRIEEICQIKTEHIISDENILSITIEDSKTEAGVRVVPIHPKLKPVINKLLKSSMDGYLIPAPAGNKYGIRSDALSKAFGRIRTAAGFGPQFVFHSIRKTVITLLQRADVPGLLIASIVGHETGTVTFDVYSAGPSPQQKYKALCKIKYNFT